MKTPSDNLFRLIKSLDRREKIFFKIYSRNKGHNDPSVSYLQLFDAIDKLKIYNESLLRTKLKKSRFEHDLNQAKKYLAKAIMNSLREYHSDTSVNTKLQKLLQNADVLIEKELFDLAEKNLLRAEKLAMEYEVYNYMPAIYSLKENVMLRLSQSIKNVKDYLNHGALQEKKYLTRLKNRTAFRNLLSQILLITNTNTNLAKAQVSEMGKINSILSSPLLSSPDKALTFSSLQDYYYIHFLGSALLDKWDAETYRRQKEWVEYIESDKIKIAERSYAYLSALLDFMAVQIKMDRMDAANESYKKMQRFYFSLKPKKRIKAILTQFAGGSFNYMAIYLIKGHPEKAMKTWEDIKRFVPFNQLNPRFFLARCFNISQGYFMLGNYHEALKWVNKIVNFREKNSLNIQAATRIYMLLVHYELGNYDMLPYLAKSAQRFLVNYNYFSEFEKIMVNFFEKKIHRATSKKEHTEAFRDLKKQLQVLFMVIHPFGKNTKQVPVREDFEYMSWIESKIENRSFAEIVRQKADSPSGG